MSDTATHQGVRRVTRVRQLGDAVPIVRPFRDDSDDVKVTPKTADELRADAEARRDAQPMSTSCAVTGCGFAYTGTAGECRTEAAGHRAAVHPELAGVRTYRKGIAFKRRGQEVDEAVIAESRRLRQEREDAQRVETINRGRRARGETLLEEVAAERLGPDGATSSSSPTTRPEETMRRTWTRDTLIAALQTVAGELGRTPTSAELTARKLSSLVTAKFLATHGFESFADLCRAAGLTPNTTGRNGGRPPRAVKTVVGVPPAIAAPPVPAPEPVADGGSLAALATELETATADLKAAQERHDAAVVAFVSHTVVKAVTGKVAA
jgi:hypothetical protein